MKIRIYGKHKRVATSTVRKMAEYYAACMFEDNKKLGDKITLNIVFSERQTQKGYHAWCNWVDRRRLPRKIKIAIKPSAPSKLLPEQLAHEMTHLYQMATGMLNDIAGMIEDDPYCAYWKGKYYNDGIAMRMFLDTWDKKAKKPGSSIVLCRIYDKRPWERHAIRWSKILVKGWLGHG
jgi:hypothetical protein